MKLKLAAYWLLLLALSTVLIHLGLRIASTETLSEPGFWLSAALAGMGSIMLALTVLNYKSVEEIELEARTCLRLRKRFFFWGLIAVFMEGEADGIRVLLFKRILRRDHASAFLIFELAGPVAAGYSLVLFRRGLGFQWSQPPDLSPAPDWVTANHWVLRGEPGGAAAAGAERVWRAAGGAAFPRDDFYKLEISPAGLRAMFYRSTIDHYSPEEVKERLDLCLKMFRAQAA